MQDEGLAVMYGWVRGARQVLMQHLATLPHEAYLAPRPELAGASVRDRHMHVVDCYVQWAGRGILDEAGLPVPDATTWPDARSAWSWFEAVDVLVARLLETFEGRLDTPVDRRVYGEVLRLTPRWTLVHPMTHEFHHKGQIRLSCRLLGYPAPQADMPLPFDAG